MKEGLRGFMLHVITKYARDYEPFKGEIYVSGYDHKMRYVEGFECQFIMPEEIQQAADAMIEDAKGRA